MRAGTINCESNLPGLSKYGGVGTVKMLDMLYALLSKERSMIFMKGKQAFVQVGIVSITYLLSIN